MKQFFSVWAIALLFYDNQFYNELKLGFEIVTDTLAVTSSNLLDQPLTFAGQTPVSSERDIQEPFFNTKVTPNLLSNG
jgi:hypothetical protein